MYNNILLTGSKARLHQLIYHLEKVELEISTRISQIVIIVIIRLLKLVACEEGFPLDPARQSCIHDPT